jgi:peroxiredoxin
LNDSQINAAGTHPAGCDGKKVPPDCLAGRIGPWRLSRVGVFVLLSVLAACYSGPRPSGINAPAPDFTVRDTDRSVSLHDFKGKVVVLNFWATWCPPCVAEMPSLMALQDRMKDRITVLAVSVDEDRIAYHQFLKDHGIALLTVRDGAQKSNALYGTFKFPETYVIDRQGTIRRKFIGAVDWNDPEISSYLQGL